MSKFLLRNRYHILISLWIWAMMTLVFLSTHFHPIVAIYFGFSSMVFYILGAAAPLTEDKK